MSTGAVAIVCTRRRPDALQRCLASLAAQSTPLSRVILVAGTPDSVPAELARAWPAMPIEVIPCERASVSAARNIGLAAAGDGPALFIDDDATADSGWAAALADALAHPAVWIAGGEVIDARTGRPEFRRGLLRRDGRQRPVSPGPAASRVPRGWWPTVKGCNFGVRAAEARALGGFDPFYAFAFDEADLVMRVWTRGGLVEHVPDAIVWHAHEPGGYRGSARLDRDWYVELASHAYFAARHNRAPTRAWVLMLLARRSAAVAAAMMLGGRGVQSALAAARGARHGLNAARANPSPP